MRSGGSKIDYEEREKILTKQEKNRCLNSKNKKENLNEL